jgi:hypothetical protein
MAGHAGYVECPFGCPALARQFIPTSQFAPRRGAAGKAMRAPRAGEARQPQPTNFYLKPAAPTVDPAAQALANGNAGGLWG